MVKIYNYLGAIGFTIAFIKTENIFFLIMMVFCYSTIHLEFVKDAIIESIQEQRKNGS